MVHNSPKTFLNYSTKNKGFSLVELLVVVAIVFIVATLAIVSFSSRALYYADHQAYLLMDAIKEARQRAITQRETIRLEISEDKRQIRLINENEAGDVSDDVVFKVITLANSSDLTFNAAPDNIGATPEEPTPVPTIEFKTSVHPLSQSEKVATLRFLKNSNVVNAGSNAIGDNSAVTGATIYFWKPKVSDDGAISDNGEVIRAVTVLGSSGNSNYWKCPVENDQCSSWKK